MPLVTRSSQNANLFKGSSAPGDTTAGNLFSDTDDNTLYIADGSDYDKQVGKTTAEVLAKG